MGGWRVLWPLGVAGMAASAGIGGDMPAWSAPPAPASAAASSELATAIATSEGAGSVHVVSHLVAGHRSATFVGDAAAHAGTQTVTIGSERATVIVVGGVAYIRGNRAAVISYFGFPKSVAPRLANRWISVLSSDQGYSDVSAAVTVASVLQQVEPTGSLTMSTPLRRAGRRVVRISGAVSGGTSTLFVSATGAPLIMSSVTHERSGTVTATFSHWGEPVNLRAPADAIPIASIGAG